MSNCNSCPSKGTCGKQADSCGIQNTSRKSVIGLTLDLPADQRLEGTLVTTVLAVMKGYAFVRVHDVKENLRAIRMTEAILAAGRRVSGQEGPERG